MCISNVWEIIPSTWQQGTFKTTSINLKPQFSANAVALLKERYLPGDSVRDLLMPDGWRSRLQPLKGSRELTIPKRVTKNCQVPMFSRHFETKNVIKADLNAIETGMEKAQAAWKTMGGLESGDLEHHPMTCKWKKKTWLVSPLRIGLWDPLEMAPSHI